MTLIWLGWWCRRYNIEGTRLLCVAILPSRCYASAFAGLGSLLAGAVEYTGGLRWEQFKALPPGKDVYWRTSSEGSSYGGTVVASESGYSDLVPIRIVDAKKKDIGMIWYFSKSKFDSCRFSASVLPTSRRMEGIEKAHRVFRGFGLEPNPHWLESGDTEALIITNQAKFLGQTGNLRIGISEAEESFLNDVLLVGSNSDKSISKLRLVSPGSPTDNQVPLSILDGVQCMGTLELLEGRSVLVLLSRSEYTNEIDDFLLEARRFSINLSQELISEIPKRFPPEIEITAFSLPVD